MVAQAFNYRKAIFLFLIALIVQIHASPILAQTWSAYQLRTANFQVSTDWRVANHWRDQAYDFVSPDNQIELWVRWWFPDEPLIGHSDAQSHEKQTLAGQDALLIRSESGLERSVQVAFLDKDENGEQLLVQLVSSTASLKALEDQMFLILEQMTLNGRPALEEQTPLSTAGVQDQSYPPLPGYHYNEAGDFSVALPSSWSVKDGQSNGAAFTFALSDEQDAAILVASASSTSSPNARSILDTYLGFLYRDSVLVKSIKHESYPELAGYIFHAIDVDAKLYEIEGTPLPFNRGRVMIYQGGTDYNGFLILTFRKEKASEAALPLLDQITQSVTIGQPVDSSGTRVAQNEDTGTKQQIKLPNNAAISSAPLVGAEWQPQIEKHLKSECFLRSKEEWDHPTKTVMADAGVDFRFVMQCEDFDHTVFGVSFQYDMRAKTEDFFHPLYFNMMKANNGRPYSFLEIRDHLFASLKQEANGNLKLSFTELAAPDPTPPMTEMAQMEPAPSDAPPVEEPQTKTQISDYILQPDKGLLFDGQALGDRWLAMNNYEKHFKTLANFTSDGLDIAWQPEDKVGFLGIYSKEAMLWLSRFNKDAEARITVKLDGASSKGLAIGMRQTYANAHNLLGNKEYLLSWTQQEDGRFHYQHRLVGQEKDGQLISDIERIPDHVTLVLRPSGVSVEAEGIEAFEVPYVQLLDGAGLRFWVYAVAGKDKSGRLKLKEISYDYKPGALEQAGNPAQGVEPLQRVTLLDAASLANWDSLDFGDAKFSELSTRNKSEIKLSRQAKPANGNRIALASKAPFIKLDERVETTPYEIEIAINPKLPNLGGRIILTSNPKAYTKSEDVAITLEKLTEGPDAGQSRLTLHANHFFYGFWSRLLPKGWVEDAWDGRIRLTLGDKWFRVSLGGDAYISVNSHKIVRGRELHMVFVPGGLAYRAGGEMSIRSVTSGWKTPDGMTEVDRQHLVDLDKFDAELFADLLASERASQ